MKPNEWEAFIARRDRFPETAIGTTFSAPPNYYIPGDFWKIGGYDWADRRCGDWLVCNALTSWVRRPIGGQLSVAVGFLKKVVI